MQTSNKLRSFSESESENGFVENNIDSDFFNKKIKGGSLVIDNYSAESTKGTQYLLTFYDQ